MTMQLAPEVRQALVAGRPVVALESTIIAHGLPRPGNLEVARRLEGIVRDRGAVPATIAVLDGVARIGLDDEGLERVASDPDMVKLSARDLPMAIALSRSGATTVAATAHLAAEAGVRVFATGGVGGVHREARESWDESADLAELARTPIVVVSAGVKSVLDVGATLERLETLGVPVIGYRTDFFPGFYLTATEHRLDWRVDSPEQVAAVVRSFTTLGMRARAVLVANPIPEAEQLDPTLHDRVLHTGLALLETQRIHGKEVTPFLLEHFHRATGGASLQVNTRLVEHNVDLGARIAAAL